MTTNTLTLYRAGDSDIMTGPTSFAADMSVARAYLDNPGFGGRRLYVTRVEVEAKNVLDIRSNDDADQVRALVEITGIDMGAVTADYMLAQDRVVDALVGRGYHWVRLIDTYPVGAETWTWLYAGDEPEMELHHATRS